MMKGSAWCDLGIWQGDTAIATWQAFGGVMEKLRFLRSSRLQKGLVETSLGVPVSYLRK